MKNIREVKRAYRHKRIRKKISGTNDCPRLYVHRSLKNMQAHVVDDTAGKVLFGVSTLDKDFRQQNNKKGNIQAAARLGEVLAQKASSKGVKKVRFDRGGCLFHGRIKAFADAARKGGLQF